PGGLPGDRRAASARAEPDAQRAPDPLPRQRRARALPGAPRRPARRDPRGVHRVQRPRPARRRGSEAGGVPGGGRGARSRGRGATEPAAAEGAGDPESGERVMADQPDILQLLAGEAVSFFEWIGDAIGDPLAKSALIKDLGGNPVNAPDAPALPQDHLDAVKSYRDASDPTAEQGAQALADIAVLLDAVASVTETWLHSAGAGAQETGHALLDLAASNYFRLRFPRLFMVLQF